MQPILADISLFVEKRLRWIVTSNSVLPQDTTTASDDDIMDDIWGRGGGGRHAPLPPIKQVARGGADETVMPATQRRQHPLAMLKAKGGHRHNAAPRHSQYSILQQGGNSGGDDDATSPTTKARFLAMLYCAVYDGDCPTVRRMTNFLHRRTPEDLAVFLNATEVVPFAANPYSIVHYAAASNNPEMVELVLFFEGDLTKVTRLFSVRGASAAPHAVTPMHIAVGLENFDVVRTLLAAGALAQSLRGPPSCRMSALQDALQQLGDQLAHTVATSMGAGGGLDGDYHNSGAGGGLRPLYASRDGISTPARRPVDVPTHKGPWSVWVEHGEEERAKISRGAWRADTGSFFRSRTPSPSDMRRGGGGDRRRVSSDVAAGGVAQLEQPPRSLCVTPSTHQGGNGVTAINGHRGASPFTTSPRDDEDDASYLPHRQQTSERPLFQIAVLLLHQGAEMIFNKSSLTYEAAKRLQHATVLVQRELHRRLQNHEDTGLALVIGQAAEAEQHMLLQQESQRDFEHKKLQEQGNNGAQNGDGHEDQINQVDDDEEEDEDEFSEPHRRLQTSTGVATRGGAAAAKPSAHQRQLPPSTIVRLMNSVTPSHETFIKRVIASRVRQSHRNRLASLDIRQLRTSTTTQGDMGAAAGTAERVSIRIPAVGSAVWVLPSSRYYPNPVARARTFDALLTGTRATKVLTDAAQDLIQQPVLCAHVLEASNALLRLVSTGGDPDAPTTVEMERPIRQPRMMTTSNASHRLASPPPSATLLPAISASMVDSSHGHTAAGHTAAAAGEQTDDNVHDAGVSLLVPSLAIPMLNDGPSDDEWKHPQHDGASNNNDRPPPPLTRLRSFVQLTETSRNTASRSGGSVFSQSLKVGASNTVVGCVACVVALPDHLARTAQASLLAKIGSDVADSNNEDFDDNSGTKLRLRAGGSIDSATDIMSQSPEDPFGGTASGRRLFVGLVVEPIYNTDAMTTTAARSAQQGLLIPAAVARARQREEQENALMLGTMTSSAAGGGGAGNPSHSSSAQQQPPEHMSEADEMYRRHVIASSPLADGLGRTLPFCSLFVPIEDIVMVDQPAAAQVVEHRLRRSLHVLGDAITAAQRERDKASAASAVATTTTYASIPGIPAHFHKTLHKDQLDQLSKTFAGAAANPLQTTAGQERGSGMQRWLKERRKEQDAQMKALNTLRQRRF